MARQRRDPSNTMSNQDNKAAQKNIFKNPKNKFKDMEICDLNDRI